MTRALLSAETYEQAVDILRDTGCGAGDGCSVNMTFIRQEGDFLFRNIEMGPAAEEESQLDIATFNPGEFYFHVNMYVFYFVGYK